MIIDRENCFSLVQAVTVTANSTDVIDLLSVRDIARGFPIRVRVQVDTAFTAAGAATLQTQLVCSASSTLSSPTVILDSTAIGKATLVAGYVIMDAVIPVTSLRYLGLIFTVATGPMTAGAVSGMVVLNTETAAGDAIRKTGKTGY